MWVIDDFAQKVEQTQRDKRAQMELDSGEVFKLQFYFRKKKLIFIFFKRCVELNFVCWCNQNHCMDVDCSRCTSTLVPSISLVKHIGVLNCNIYLFFCTSIVIVWKIIDYYSFHYDCRAFSLRVINVTHPEKSVERTDTNGQTFDHLAPDWGFQVYISLLLIIIL